jgi:myo-inositol-1(or 4)-monophosphatase
MNYSEILTKLEPAIMKAGEIIMAYQNKDKKIEYKEAINLVTAADRDSEIFIYNEIHRIFPDDSILAEEGHKKQGTSGYTWVVDPVDGTTSFAHGFPFFCISAGLIDQNNEPVLGFIYAPMLNEKFTAYKNGGAFLNGLAVHVSDVKAMSGALIGTGFPYNRRTIMDKLMRRLANFLHEVHDVRRTGSAALDIAYVACGRLDAYYEEGLQPWDVCAAAIVLKEAGGFISKFNGDSFDLFFPEAAVSNSSLHNELLEILAKT